MISIAFASVFVDDQAKALAFYTEKLGFTVCADIPMGEHRWLTVVGEDDSVELLLEPDVHPAVRPFKEALVADGIPCTSFQVADVAAEVERLRAAGVTIVREPMAAGPVTVAVFDDTCGNLIQIAG